MREMEKTHIVSGIHGFLLKFRMDRMNSDKIFLSAEFHGLLQKKNVDEKHF